MINKELINYSLRNLKHRKGRSFLTIFSILIGIATIFIFISFGLGLYNYTQTFVQGGSADKVLIMAKGLSGSSGLDTGVAFTDADIRAIKGASGVYQATGIYDKIVQITESNENKYTVLISYDPSVPIVLQSFNAELDSGRLLQSSDTKKAVLGYNYKIDGKIFKKAVPLGSQIEINGTKFQVVGFLKALGNPQDDASIYITNDYFKTLYPQTNSYAEIVAKVDIKNIDTVVSNIQQALRNERNEKKGQEDFFVQSFQDLLKSYMSVLDIIIGFVILIALTSVLVSGINTANTMITSVLERFKEIGILKSMGARNSEVLGIFLFESAFLGMLAGILGVMLGFVMTTIAGNILANLGLSFLKPYYSFWLFLGCILFATLTGAISGVIPAIKASKINTVDALRYE